MERKSVIRQNITVVLISVLIDIAFFVFAGLNTAIGMGVVLLIVDGLITFGIYLKAITGNIDYYKDKKIVWARPRHGLLNNSIFYNPKETVRNRIWKYIWLGLDD